MRTATDREETVPDPEAAPSRQPADCPLEIDSASLLKGRQEMRINHDGSTYTLRRTRGGKLILTK